MPVMWPAVVERIFSMAVSVPSNSLLGEAGAEPRVFCLQSGTVVREDSSGKALSVIWPGEFIEKSTECRALTDCRCLARDQASFDKERVSNLELACWLSEETLLRNAELHQRIDWFVNRRAEERILSVLWEQTRRALETTGAATIPLAQLQVAQLAGATRETASMLLHRLREQGLIDYRRRSIHVSEPGRLGEYIATALSPTPLSSDSISNQVSA